MPPTPPPQRQKPPGHATPIDHQIFRSTQTLFTTDDFRLWRAKREAEEPGQWSLKHVGRRVGVSASLLCRIERGERVLEPRLAIRLLRVCFSRGAAPETLRGRYRGR